MISCAYFRGAQLQKTIGFCLAVCIWKNLSQGFEKFEAFLDMTTGLPLTFDMQASWAEFARQGGSLDQEIKKGTLEGLKNYAFENHPSQS